MYVSYFDNVHAGLAGNVDCFDSFAHFLEICRGRTHTGMQSLSLDCMVLENAVPSVEMYVSKLVARVEQVWDQYHIQRLD